MEGEDRSAWWIPVVAGAAVVVAFAWWTHASAPLPTPAPAPRADDADRATPPTPTLAPEGAPPLGPTAVGPSEVAAAASPIEDPSWAELGPNAGLAPVVGTREAMATAATVAADRAADRAMGRLERAVAALPSHGQWTPDVRLKVEAELDAVADALDEGVRSVVDRSQPLGVVVPNMDALAEQAAQRIADVVGEPVTLTPLEPVPTAPGAGTWEGIPIDAWAAPTPSP